MESLNKDTLISAILNEEKFKGFGQFIFPTQWGNPDSSMTLNEVDSLLPYHSHIDVDTTIKVIDYMYQQVNDQHQIFYDIYSDEEKKKDPTKKDTGLFFF